MINAKDWGLIRLIVKEKVTIYSHGAFGESENYERDKPADQILDEIFHQVGIKPHITTKSSDDLMLKALKMAKREQNNYKEMK
jgi:hypothetical protein